MIDDPEVKAERLLWEILTPDLYFQFARHGHFKIKIGRRFYYFYRGSKTQSMDERNVVLSYCIHLSKKTPDADRIAAEYLLLTNNEAEYLRTANATVVSGSEPDPDRRGWQYHGSRIAVCALAYAGLCLAVAGAIKLGSAGYDSYHVPELPVVALPAASPRAAIFTSVIRQAYPAEAPPEPKSPTTLSFPDGRVYERYGDTWIQMAGDSRWVGSLAVVGTTSAGIVTSVVADCGRSRYPSVDRTGALCSGATVFAGYLTSSISTATSHEINAEAADGPTP